MLKSNKWYSAEQGKEFPSLPYFQLHLKLTNGKIIKGYYFDEQFYCGDKRITSKVSEFFIPQHAEEVHSNWT
jgi:hypothetical protein